MIRKLPCRLYFTVDVDVAVTGAGALVQGHTLQLGDRILLTEQADADRNGLYVVGANALSRASDANAPEHWVHSWDVQAAERIYRWIHPGTFTLDTTPVVLERVQVMIITDGEGAPVVQIDDLGLVISVAGRRLQLRRGTAAQIDALVPAPGEILAVIDNPGELRIGDGSTPGGLPVSGGGATLPRVANPGFIPDGGTFEESVQVTLLTATEGASIRYTTDGSTPSSTHGTLYSTPFTLTATTTVRAIAFKEGMADSHVIARTFTLGEVGTNNIHWGPSTNTTLDGTQILALANHASRSTAAGSYNFVIPGPAEQYWFFSWPHTGITQPTGFSLDGFSLQGDFAGADQGYDQIQNGFPFKIVQVGGQDYRLYRSLHPLGASNLTVIVTDS